MRLTEENFRQQLLTRADKKLTNDVAAYIQKALQKALVAHTQSQTRQAEK